MTDFIEGKWYKNIGANDNCYAKVLKIDDEKLYIEYSVDLNRDLNTYNPNEAYFSKESYRKAELLEDLTEIEPYLPEGHPDKKFVLPINYYLRVTEENREVLGKWLGLSSPSYLTVSHIAGLALHSDGKLKTGYNPINIIKSDEPDGYDFGQEITYEQFKKYVLNQQEENYSYLDKLLSKWNIK